MSSKVIWEIESELIVEYWPGAIAWADKNHDNAWSNALNDFDYALTEARRTKDWNYIWRQGEVYKKTILLLLQWYKKSQSLDDKEAFLTALKQKGGIK